jgi:hypothetical protein
MATSAAAQYASKNNVDYLSNINQWIDTNKNATPEQVNQQMSQYGISEADIVKALTQRTDLAPGSTLKLGDTFYQRANNPYKKYGGAVLRPYGTTPAGSLEQRGVPQTEEDKDIPSRSTPEATTTEKITSNQGPFSTQKKRVYVSPSTRNVEMPRGG